MSSCTTRPPGRLCTQYCSGLLIIAFDGHGGQMSGEFMSEHVKSIVVTLCTGVATPHDESVGSKGVGRK